MGGQTARTAPIARCDELVGFTDLLATLAELWHADVSANLDSVSFMPCLLGQSRPDPRPPTVMKSANGAMAIRSGNWMLIDRPGSGGFIKRYVADQGANDVPGQLHDLSNDLGEKQSRYRAELQTVEKLKSEQSNIVSNAGSKERPAGATGQGPMSRPQVSFSWLQKGVRTDPYAARPSWVWRNAR
jgi:hypothetical protein